MGRLQNRVALVTGAGRGVGRAIAEALAAEGAQVVASDIDPATAEATAARTGGSAIAADVTDREAVQALVDSVVDRHGTLDILVANAGVISVDPVVELSEEAWDRIFAVNTKGVFLCAQAAARVMIEQGRGRIIATASNAAKTGEPYIAHYCASKFAVLGFIQSLALELAPHRINANCVCPVMVSTDMMEDLSVEYARVMGGEPASHRAAFDQQVPWGRMARPEDVAGVVTFLASDEAAFLTGQGINVSGGLEVH